MLKLFFDILKGNVLEINETNIEQILDAIYFLESDTLSFRNIAQNSQFNFAFNDLSSLFSLPVESIQATISCPSFHSKNENQLFELLFDKIRKDRDFLFFIKYVSFGNINSLNFNCLIQSIQFHELNESLFDHLKYSLFFNYFLFAENESQRKDIQSTLSISKDIQEYFQNEKEKEELKFLFDLYPILSAEIFEISSSGNALLLLTKNQNDQFL
jgi:hypothetical protein